MLATSLARGPRAFVGASCSRVPSRHPHLITSTQLRPRLICTAAAEEAAVEVAEEEVVVDGPPKSGVCHLRFQRGSPFKVRRVLDTIRGRSYEEALQMMEYMPYRACEKIAKCLISAAANAKENAKASKAKLVVAEAFADKGPNLKRARPRAKGRPGRILKPLFHLTIKLAEQ